MIHDFKTKLERSRQGMAAAPLIQAWLDGCVGVRPATDEEDRNGVDYWATLRHGAVVGIDHKLREAGCSRFWRGGPPELALEIWSVIPMAGAPRGVVGWTLNQAKNTDYILYTFDAGDSDRAYLLPFQLLRMSFIRYMRTWDKRYEVHDQDSGRWKSRAVFVPAPVVVRAVTDEMQH